MGIKLIKSEIDRLINLKNDCERADETLSAAINTYNDAVDAAWRTFEDNLRVYAEALNEAQSELSSEIESHDTVLNDAKEYLDALANDREAQISERSERWQESEAGENAQSLVDALREMESYESFEPEFVEAPEVEEPQHIDQGSIPAASGMIESIIEM
ncbi:hypothetical protein [Roseibium sp. RKSG952]|uniref:hypothetical protein n=1 Tax=Roseibium sp. RKSG952 TaxID=2529384 RepID=UPI0012BC146B|nr:hypothetical protein [Roseibium sp. RKSG952]MTH95249.1 hypothetical protein [Roseibium sp. RKSG952]